MREELAEHLSLIQSKSDRAVLFYSLDLMREGTSGRSSFELHAPLEIMARYHLLPWVGYDFRHVAHAQMLATALDFRRIAKPFPVKRRGVAKVLPGSWQEYETGMGADASWRNIAADLQQPRAHDLRAVLHLLGDRVVANAGAAGHGHVLLAHAIDADSWICERLAPHLRMFVEWYASDDDTEGEAALDDLWILVAAEEVEDVADFLAAIPRSTAGSEHRGIRGILDRALKTGFDCSVADSEDAWPLGRCVAAMEVAARFMLLETDEIEYGWSHCLTLPEAACTLAENVGDGEMTTHVAVSYVAAFISALRSGAPLPPLQDDESTGTQVDLLHALTGDSALGDAPAVALGMKDEELAGSWQLICSLASARPDAHLAKYVFACLRCASGRSLHHRLFLAAAAKLLAAWMQRFPDDMPLGELLTDRLA